MFAGYVARATIEHNTIANTARADPTQRPTYPRPARRPVGRSAQGYTGISLGWGWGDHVTGAQTFMADNHVASNRISAVVSELNDGELLRLPPLLHLPSLPTDDDSRLSCARRGAGGCIYTLGPQPRSSVRANYCDADRAPVVGSFYHDNGTSHRPPRLTPLSTRCRRTCRRLALLCDDRQRRLVEPRAVHIPAGVRCRRALIQRRPLGD